MLAINTVRSGFSNGTSSGSPDWQSMRMSRLGLPKAEANWSMMPQGTSAKSCSAFWHSSAFSRVSNTVSSSPSRNVAMAHSSAAEDDKPAPPGIEEMMNASKPGM